MFYGTYREFPQTENRLRNATLAYYHGSHKNDVKVICITLANSKIIAKPLINETHKVYK